jgi:hypothetical protein
VDFSGIDGGVQPPELALASLEITRAWISATLELVGARELEPVGVTLVVNSREIRCGGGSSEMEYARWYSDE